MKKRNGIIKVFTLILMLMALVFGIVFTSISDSSNISLGSQYRGGITAIVDVYEKNSPNDTPSNPDGNSTEAAQIIKNKLSPFSTNDIDIKTLGKSRLQVSATKSKYSDKNLLRQDIEATGGIFIFNTDYKDVLFNDDFSKELNTKEIDTSKTNFYEGMNVKNNKAQIGDVFGTATSDVVTVGANNLQFAKIESKDVWSSLVSRKAGGDDEQTDLEKYSVISNVDSMLLNLRNYYNLDVSSENYTKKELAEDYFTNILSPIQTLYKELIKTGSTPEQVTQGKILNDFFQGDYLGRDSEGKIDPPNTPHKTGSLLDTNIAGTAENLEKILFTDSSHDVWNNNWAFATNSVTDYTYSANAKMEDFSSEENEETKLAGKYSNDVKSLIWNDGKWTRTSESAILGRRNITFNALTQSIIGKANFNSIKLKSFFDQNFVLNKQSVSTTLTSKEDIKKQAGSLQNFIFQDKNSAQESFYVKFDKAETVRTMVISINSVSHNFTFVVISITPFYASITNSMLILSLVVMAILALCLIIYMLITYKLLGLFTIIIAAIIGSLTIFIVNSFGIAIDPEIFAVIFIVLGFVLDISIVLFEAFKRNYYLEKRSLKASFTIGRKEVLSFIVDVVIIGLLPFVSLFWIGEGSLKNFALLLIVGICFVILFGIVILTLLVALAINTNIFIKFETLLPIDTSKFKQHSLFKQYSLKNKEQRLMALTHKEKLSSKQLIKLKMLNTKIENLTIKIQKREELKNARALKRFNKIAIKNTKKIEKTNINQTKNNFITKIISKLKTQKVVQLQELNNSIAKISDHNDLENIDNTNNEIKKNYFKKIIFWFSLLLLVIVPIGSVLAVLTPTPLAQSFGVGTVALVSQPELNLMRENIINFVDTTEDTNHFNKIKQELETINTSSSNSEDQNLIAAQIVTIFYKYVLKDGLMEYVIPSSTIQPELHRFNSAREIVVPDIKASYDVNESQTNNNDNSTVHTGKDYIVKFSTTKTKMNNDRDLFVTAFKYSLLYMYRSTANAVDSSIGIYVLKQSPLTVYKQIIQLLIAIGVLLIALLVYILIRFKWTYYIALIIAFVAIIITTAALIIIFRVPMSSEVIFGSIAIVSFALSSIMIVLGKGKSILKGKDKKELNDIFKEEIELQIEFKNFKHDQTKALIVQITPLKQKIKEMKQSFKTKINDQVNKQEQKTLKKQFNQEVKGLKLEMKNLKKDFKQKIKIAKQENNYKVKNISRTNVVIKKIFNEILSFGLQRIFILGTIFIAFALVLAFTMPSEIGLGIVILIGVIASMVITLIVALPIWLKLEERRIRNNIAMNKFIRNINVSEEEQIIENIND